MNSRNKAFTLVELLVVIGIIALLISILIPTLGKARNQANEVKCMSNLRQFGLGFNMYADANKGMLPFDGEDGDKATAPIKCPDNKGWDSPSFWLNAVPKMTTGTPYSDLQARYIAGTGALPGAGDSSIFVCPTATAANVKSPETQQDGYFINYGYTETSPTSQARRTFVCYAINSKLLPSGGGGKMSKLRPASNVVILMEKRTNYGEATAKHDAYYQSQGGSANRITTRTVGRVKGDWQRFASRHRDGGNLLFADGHVSYWKMKDVLTRGNATGTADFNQAGKGLIWSAYGPANE